MKKIILLGALVAFTTPSFAEDKYACVDTDQANLRVGPGTTHAVATKMNKYTPVKILETDGQWFKIQSKFETGWLYETLISQNGNCTQALSTISTHLEPSPYSSHHPQKEKVFLNEGLFVLEEGMGVKKVKDKFGRVFWVNSDKLWPKSKDVIEL